ncbi:MAG: response regulator [Kofleriaceae bacterium]
MPGLSTATTVTELAGRGVGLDVAKQHVEAMHGSITVDSKPGMYTSFTVSLPTTVATITALVVVVEQVHYAIPTSTVERVIRVRRDKIRYVDGRSLARVGEDWVPLGTLAQVLGGTPPTAERGIAMILTHGDRRIAVQVDSSLGMFDLVVGSLDARLGRLRHIMGQARLPSGSVALLLNANDVVEDVLGMTVAAHTPPAPKMARRRILVVDDSATTRALEANILGTAGYDVSVAVDGEAALRQLNDGQFDLVVSDIDMPNLDGFGLTQAVRAIERLARLPIILVTARSSDKDRARGLRVGASAYLVKSSFDQTVLLETIDRLL